MHFLFNSQVTLLVGKNMVLRDYLMGVAYGMLFFIIIWYITSSFDKKEGAIILLSWILRIFMALVFYIIIENYYVGSNDAFGHYKTALHMESFKLLPSNETHNFRVFLHYLLLFCFNSFHAAKILMSFFGFLGSYFSYLGITKYYGHLKNKTLLAVVIFLWPSFMFWTSNLYKDALNFYLLGVSIYLVSSYFKKDLKWIHLLLAISLIPSIFVRPLGAILVSLSFLVVWIIFSRRERDFLVVGLISIFIFFLISYYLYSFYGVINFKKAFFYLCNYYYYAKYRIKIINIIFFGLYLTLFIAPIFLILMQELMGQHLIALSLKNNIKIIQKITSFFWMRKITYKNIPWKTISNIYIPLFLQSFINFFRPFPWEIKNCFMAFASLEGLILFFLFVIFIPRLFFYIKNTLFKDRDKLQWFFILYIVLWLGTAGILSSWNLGLFSRYRIQIILPFFIIIYKALLQ